MLKIKQFYQKSLICLLCFFCVIPTVFAQTGLERIHQKLIKKYDNVEHISSVEFSEMNADDLIVFDVRKEKEFAVSHLDGAIRLDPNTNADEFEQQYAEQLKGKTVVFYCSVGRRSSEMASRVDDVLSSSDVTASYNLTGGVFSWRNQERPLVEESSTTATPTTTTKVHPYNFYWGRLIEDRDAISYKPL